MTKKQEGGVAKKQLTSANYTIGYGKPPEHGKFQKGKSGNPKGRPKGSKNLASVLQGAFGQPVSMVKNGKALKVEVIDALVAKLLAMAMGGNHSAMKMAFDLYNVAHPPANDNQAIAEGSSFELSPEDWAAIEQSNLLKGTK